MTLQNVINCSDFSQRRTFGSQIKPLAQWDKNNMNWGSVGFSVGLYSLELVVKTTLWATDLSSGEYERTVFGQDSFSTGEIQYFHYFASEMTLCKLSASQIQKNYFRNIHTTRTSIFRDLLTLDLVVVRALEAVTHGWWRKRGPSCPRSVWRERRSTAMSRSRGLQAWPTNGRRSCR